MTSPEQDAAPPTDDRQDPPPPAAERLADGDAAGTEAQREAEETVRAISRLEESN